MLRQMLRLEGKAFPRLGDPFFSQAVGLRPIDPLIDELAHELGHRHATRSGFLRQGRLAPVSKVANVECLQATPP